MTGTEALDLNIEMTHWAIKEGLPNAASYHAQSAVLYAKVMHPELNEDRAAIVKSKKPRRWWGE
jgi:hypothetical protein